MNVPLQDHYAFKTSSQQERLTFNFLAKTRYWPVCAAKLFHQVHMDS